MDSSRQKAGARRNISEATTPTCHERTKETVMVPASYLRGLDADDFDLRGIYGIPHARTPGSWRIVCSYADGKRH